MPAAVGRPTKFNAAEHPEVVRKLFADGRTMQDVADALQISRTTLHEWIKEHPVLLDAMTRGRSDAVDRIEHALHKRAEGFEHKDEYYPPDVHAIKFFLGNKRSQDWREKTAVEHSGHLTLADLLTDPQPKVVTAPQGPTPHPKEK